MLSLRYHDQFETPSSFVRHQPSWRRWHPPVGQDRQLYSPVRPINSSATRVTPPNHHGPFITTCDPEDQECRAAAETLMALGGKNVASSTTEQNVSAKKSFKKDISKHIVVDPTSHQEKVLEEISNKQTSSHHLMKRNVTPPRRDVEVIQADHRVAEIDESWWQNFQALKNFVLENSHFSVYPSHPLFPWVQEQRFQYFYLRIVGSATNRTPRKHGIMTPQRYSALVGIKFPFIVGEWYQGLDQYLRFRQMYKRGNLVTNLSKWEEESNERPRLSEWIYVQQRYYNRLSLEQIALLRACGVFHMMNLYETHADITYKPVRSYSGFQVVGHEPATETVVFSNRRNDDSGDIATNGAIKKQTTLEDKLEQLRQACKILDDKDESPPVRPVQHESSASKDHEMDFAEETIRQEYESGYDSSASKDPANDRWEDKFDQLRAFRKKNGHCLVRRSHPKLGRWVANQRVQFNLMKAGRPSHMCAERVKALNSIGFLWDRSKDACWMAHYEDLLAYKEIHGDCLVPQRTLDFPGLGSWVAGQRRSYKLKKAGRKVNMTDTRVRLLEQAGFVWYCRSSSKSRAGSQKT